MCSSTLNIEITLKPDIWMFCAEPNLRMLYNEIIIVLSLTGIFSFVVKLSYSGSYQAQRIYKDSYKLISSSQLHYIQEKIKIVEETVILKVPFT